MGTLEGAMKSSKLGGFALLLQGFEGGDVGGEHIGQLLFPFGGGLEGSGEGGAAGLGFVVLVGEGLDLVDDGIDALVGGKEGLAQGVEFALVGGDGEFLLAEFGLVLLEAGLDLGLFAEQGAFVAAGGLDLILEAGELGLQFGDLVLAAENGGGALAGAGW